MRRSGRVSSRPRATASKSRDVLLGINAHINYDLPQALLAVITDEEFADPVVVGRRRRDHERIDAVLAGRVAAEDDELVAVSALTLLDRLLRPLNHLSSRRFLREARKKVWHNTGELQRARLAGEQVYAERLAELELLSAARIADLLAPGQVLLRLAVAGFGVTLPRRAQPGRAHHNLEKAFGGGIDTGGPVMWQYLDRPRKPGGTVVRVCQGQKGRVQRGP